MKRNSTLFRLGSLLTASLLSASLSAQNTSPFWSLAGNSNANSVSKLGTTTADPLNITTNNLTRLRINADGKVGIGTSSPQQLLHVEGQTLLNIFVSTSALSNISGSGQIGYTKFTPTAAGQRLGYFLFGSRGGAENNYHGGGMVGYADGAWSSTSWPTNLAFETAPSGSSTRQERMRITSGGNVGIGTTSPAQKLHVAGNAQFNGLVGINGAVNSSYALTVNATSSLQGIEVSDPLHGYVLHSVKTGINTGIYVEKTATGTGTPCIEGNSTGSSPGVSGFSSTGRGIVGISSQNDGVYGESSSSSSDGGYAGRFIGNNYRGIYAQSASGFIAGYFNGDVFTTGNYTGSDVKLKKNVEDLGDAMTIINKLQPKNYEFRTDGNYALMNLPKGRHYGLLAQDVEKVLPNIVRNADFNTKLARPQKTSPSDGGKEPAQKQEEKGEEVEFKAVNYTELTPIIVKALQEQDVVIKAQSAKIDVLTKELEQLKQIIVQNGRASSLSLSDSYLEQSAPNPTGHSATIRYNKIPNGSNARLLLFDASGKLLKQLQLNRSGSGNVNVDVSSLSAGTYTYSLMVNDKVVDTKKMEVTR